ncbi:MAG: conjugal transfer protein TraD [Methylococcaceae bacterium]|nr:conjugal transfer protein TraD [Methylococcaceae bacterium]
MTDKNEEWLNNRVLYLKGLKSRTEQQNILIELFDKQNRTQQDDKKFTALVRAEKTAERASKAKQAASHLIQAEKHAEKKAERKARDHELFNAAGLLILAGLVDTKTGKPTIDKNELLGALAGLAKVPESDQRRTEWKKAGAVILAEQK